MPQVKLTVLSVEKASTNFGATEYATFQCSTSNNEIIKVGATHNLLNDKSVYPELLDFFVGSTLLVNDSTDIQTGEFSTAEQRVAEIVNGTRINPRTGKPSEFILLNSVNGSLLKSETYLAQIKDMASSVQAKVKVEKDKEKKLLASQRLAERLRERLATASVAETEIVATAELETNEEF